MHVCMECFEIYNIKYLNKKNDYTYVDAICPKKNCHGDVVELDEMIAPAIIELNRKGYFTEYCCSGHWYEEGLNTYLVFEDAECVPNSLPKGFGLDVRNDKHCLLLKNNEDIEDECEKHLYIMKLNKNLTKWAYSLPSKEERDSQSEESFKEIFSLFKSNYESLQDIEKVEIEDRPFMAKRKMKFRVINKKDDKSLSLFSISYENDKHYPAELQDMDNDYTINNSEELKSKIKDILEHRFSILQYHYRKN